MNRPIYRVIQIPTSKISEVVEEIIGVGNVNKQFSYSSRFRVKKLQNIFLIFYALAVEPS